MLHKFFFQIIAQQENITTALRDHVSFVRNTFIKTCLDRTTACPAHWAKRQVDKAPIAPRSVMVGGCIFLTFHN
jgi:hypothetical protein